MTPVQWRVELVGGPFCGRWFPLRRWPEDREFVVKGFNVPVCLYFLETDDLDCEQRAIFVRSYPPMVPVVP